MGNPIVSTDPLGRETSIEYANDPLNKKSYGIDPTSSGRKSMVIIKRSSPSHTMRHTLGDGLCNYQWDAENRLVKIARGGSVDEFVYDSLSRRVAEKINGIDDPLLVVGR